MTEKVNLHVDDANLSDVFNRISDGRYRIPEFQREYVWDTSEVTELFDSIYNSYPIGSLFLWEVPEEMNQFFRDTREFGQPSVEDVRYQVSFVLDGQQRLTSLYIALEGLEFEGYDYSRILFNIDDEEFTLGKPTADHLISVSDIWDQQSRFELLDDMIEERRRAVQKCSDRLHQYQLPLIQVESGDVDSVISIFERINQTGRDLSRFDIVNANIWTKDFNLRQRIDNDIVERLQESSFGDVERDTVAQAISLILEGNCTTESQKNLDADEVEANWPDLKDAFLHAVDYIRRRYNIQRVEFLPYESLISILAYYIHESESETVVADHQEQIDRYFWRVVFSDHWATRRQGTIGNDTEIIDEIIAGRNPSFDFPITITPDKLKEANIKRSNSAVRNAFLCILANNEPLNPKDGTAIELHQNHYADFKLEKHHIFPNRFLLSHDFDKSERKSVIDITFLPRSVNNQISDKAPSNYFRDWEARDDFEEIMYSHFIPYGPDSAIWDDDYDLFLDQRASLIMEKVQDLVGETSLLEYEEKSAEQRIEDGEEMLRDTIHKRLRSSNGDGYWDILPSGVVSSVKEQVDSDLDEYDARERLEFVELADCSDIINIHWSEFSDVFPDGDDVEHHLKNLEVYRDSFGDEDMDRYTRLDGDLAIQWINSCIESTIEEVEA